MKADFQILRGNKANLPNRLESGRLAFCIDTLEIYIGMGSEKPPVRIADFKSSNTAIKYGSTEFTDTDNKTIIFEKPFANENYGISTTVEGEEFRNVLISNVTNSSFNIKVDGACKIHWFAIQR